MRTIPIAVDGLPPNIKKNKKSMRRLDTQRTRLHALVTEARRQLGGQALTGEVRLTLRIHVGSEYHIRGDKNFGDLDNFVSGVCDGLEGVAFDNDECVVKIDAERIRSSGDHCYYKVILEELGDET